MSDMYGPLFVSGDFDDAVVACIDKWVDSYLAQFERHASIPVKSIDRPRSYNIVSDLDQFNEDQSPAVFVVSAGLEDLEETGGGNYAGWWRWVVWALVAQRDPDATQEVRNLYGASLRTLVVQKAALEDLGTTVFVGESYEAARNRTLGIMALEFRSYIDAVVNEFEGPVDPDIVPPSGEPDPNAEGPRDENAPDWPLVETTDIQIEKDPLDE